MREKRIQLRDAVVFFVTTFDETFSSYPEATDLEYVGFQIAQGNVTMTLNEGIEYENDRDRLDDVLFAPDQPMDLSINGKFGGFCKSGVGEYSPLEIITGRKLSNAAQSGLAYWPRLTGLPEQWLMMDGEDVVACVPYCTWVELHLNPKLSCPGVDAIGEAILFRYFRADGGSNVDISGGELNASGKAHIMQPLVHRGIFDYASIDDALCVPAITNASVISDFTAWSVDPRNSSGSL